MAVTKHVNFRHRTFICSLLGAVVVLLLASCSGSDASGAHREPGGGLIGYEAEELVGGGRFVTEDDAAASGGRIVRWGPAADGLEAPVESATVAMAPGDLGAYSLWVRVKADRAGRTFASGLDGKLVSRTVPQAETFVWVEVERRPLAEEEHRISLGHADPEVAFDLFVLVGDADVQGPELEARFAPKADGGGDPPDGDSDASPDPAPDGEPSREPSSLRGDPGFDVQNVPGPAREWHARVLSGIGASLDRMVERARTDNSYKYGRTLFQYDSALLLALRATGDLRFLDAVDRVAQGMRSQLWDGWCGGVDGEVDVNSSYGTVREQDGYANFRWRGDTGHRNHCRDVGDLDEALTHGHLAMLMYAYHVNRDLESPGGVDYGERADFWLEYLRNDFEAKWRTRSDTSWPDMDFLDLKFCHTFNQFILYHYFIGARLQEEGDPDASAYLGRARAMTDAMFDEPYGPGDQAGGFVDVDTPLGPAVVYSFGTPGGAADGVKMEACPTTYARYATAAMLALHLEGFDRWDDGLMRRLANGLAHFVMDTEPVTASDRPFAAGVSGSARVAEMPPTEYRSRVTLGKFATTMFAALAPWDATGKVARLSVQTYEALEDDLARPERVAIPAAALFAETMPAAASGFTVQ